MEIITHPVVNFDDIHIKVKFLVIHYTAINLNQTLSRFNQPQFKVSSHFVIDENGLVYECVPALQLLSSSTHKNYNGDNSSKTAKKAWHSGQSSYTKYKNLNDYSIGIELIHSNGNFFHYSTKQIQSLIELTKKLIKQYQSLNHPKQIIGHENIATERGKVDPGYCFDWQYYLKEVFTSFDEKQIDKIARNRATIHPTIYQDLNHLFQNQEHQLSIKSPFWAIFNQWLEYSQMRMSIKD